MSNLTSLNLKCCLCGKVEKSLAFRTAVVSEGQLIVQQVHPYIRVFKSII